MLMKCPKCGCDNFYVLKYTAEVWEIDCEGNLIHMFGLAPDSDIFPDESSPAMCKACGEIVDYERSYKDNVIKLFG